MIPSAKYLKNKAGNRLAGAAEPQKILLIYAAISLGTSLLVTAVRFCLANEIAQTGGLRNMGIRSVLSTADTVLPMLQIVLMLCLNLGFAAAMLRISRRQFASPMTLKVGVERFWVLLRTRVLMFFVYSGVGFVSFYLSIALFMLSPLSGEFKALAMPLVTSGELDPQALAEQPELLEEIMPSMIPMFILFGVLLAAVCLVLSYRYRLVDYLLIDNPQFGASYALRMSRVYMHGQKLTMFKLDLSYWWYYLLTLLTTLILYSDVLLAALGISLPLSADAMFWITVIASLGANFAVVWFFQMKLEITYALAYDAIVPRAKPEDGAVLGNIFQM